MSNGGTLMFCEGSDFLLPIQIDLKNRESICDQIVSSIIRLASCGVLQEGEKLPSVRELAQQLALNPNTVQKSYRTLELMGIIYSRPGCGSFISGGSEALELRRRKILKELDRALKHTMDAGVTAAELRDHVHDWLAAQQIGGLSE